MKMSTTSIYAYVLKLHLEITLKICGYNLLLSSVEHLYLIVVLFGEDQRTNTIKDTCLKEIELHFWILMTTPHSIVNTIRRILRSMKLRQRTHSWKK